jgi:hypothetical protein
LGDGCTAFRCLKPDAANFQQVISTASDHVFQIALLTRSRKRQKGKTMIGNGPMQGFRVRGRGVADIRLSADNVRKILAIGDDLQKINVGLFLDNLSVEYGITYDVLEHHEMPHPDVEACCDPSSMTMYIRSDVFESGCWQDPRSRFTVMHELGHALLGHERTINRQKPEHETKIYEDSEWQANQFAAEILMPLDVIKKYSLNSALDIQTHFNVSFLAANNRVNQLNKRGELPC